MGQWGEISLCNLHWRKRSVSNIVAEILEDGKLRDSKADNATQKQRNVLVVPTERVPCWFHQTTFWFHGTSRRPSLFVSPTSTIIIATQNYLHKLAPGHNLRSLQNPSRLLSDETADCPLFHLLPPGHPKLIYPLPEWKVLLTNSSRIYVDNPNRSWSELFRPQQPIWPLIYSQRGLHYLAIAFWRMSFEVPTAIHELLNSLISP